MADFAEAARLDPRYQSASRSFPHLGITFFDEDNKLAELDRTIERDPSKAEAYTLRCVINLSKGNSERAIADATDAIRLGSKDVANYKNRGIAYGRRGEYDAAIADFTEAIRLNPRMALSYHNRGEVYRAKMEFDKAIADFDQAVRLHPKSGAAFRNRGFAHFAMKDHAKAIEDFTQAIRLDAGDMLATSALAWLLATCTDH